MVVAKLAFNLARGKMLESLVNQFIDFYKKWVENRAEHEAEIGKYRLDGLNYFREGSLAELSERYGLEGKLKGYSASVHNYIKSYLAQLKELTDYLRNAVNKQIPEAILYAKALQAKTTMAKLVGDYQTERRKKYGYLSDLGSELDYIGNMNKEVEKFLELASGFDTQGSRLRYATAKRLLKWAGKQIFEQNDIPAHALDKILTFKSREIIDIKKAAVPLFAEYQQIVKKIKSNYAGDIASGVYVPLAA